MFEFEAEFNTPDTAGETNEIPADIQVTLDEHLLIITPQQTEQYDYGTKILSGLSELDTLRASIVDLEAEQKDLEAKKRALREEFAIRMKVITDRELEVDEAIRPSQRRIRELQLELQRLYNLLREAVDADRVKNEFKRKAFEYDTLTASCYWREFAMEHQIEGAKYLAAAGKCILGDKPGLGKTLTSLITCDMREARKVLIITPDDVVSNFKAEVQHWAPHRTVIMLGKQTPGVRAFLLDTLEDYDEFTVVMNYSAWRKDSTLLERLSKLRFDTMIFDEAHLLKNIKTSAYEGCRQLVLAENSCPKCGGAIKHVDTPKDFLDDLPSWERNQLGKKSWSCAANEPCGWSQVVDILSGTKRPEYYLASVKNVIPMTGTPILNKPEDLYAMLSLVDPVHFEPNTNGAKDFNYTYCVQDWQGRWVFAPGGMQRLVQNISGKYIARDRKSAGVVLPKQDVIIHSIELDQERYPAQTKVIKDLTRHAMLRMKSGAQVPMLLMIELILRKRQANVWPAGIQWKDENGIVVLSVGDEVRESIKLDLCCDITNTLDPTGMIPDFTGNGDLINGERVVVFSQFKGPLIELERRLKLAGISVVRFDGDTPNHIKDMVKIDFDRKHCDQPGYEVKWQVCLANYKTGGVGLNLNGATQTIILDEEWNPGKREQAYNRTDRIGQTEETQVHVIRLENTIDDWMANLIAGKETMTVGFEENTKTLAEQLLDGLDNGEML